VEELFEFYQYGHFTRFIQRGAVRIESTPGTHEFNSIAFRNPDGSMALIAVNTTDQSKQFAVSWQGRLLKSELGIKSVATFMWR
jgi:glucosylceramidase